MAGLQVDVLRVKNGKRGIEIGVKIFNDHDLKVSFDLCDVRMKCDKELSPANPKGQSVRLDIQPKTYREFRWTFPLEAPLPPGSYTIEIKSLYELDVLLPNKVEFQFNV
ncbi:MAG: hypothetical protein JNK78_19765 [Planctomycetes bacterium]|nr:hypothetical protein [Planctomycetota bacterium]